MKRCFLTPEVSWSAARWAGAGGLAEPPAEFRPTMGSGVHGAHTPKPKQRMLRVPLWKPVNKVSAASSRPAAPSA